MKQRFFFIFLLFILFFAFMAGTLLAGQNRRLRLSEERLFRSREELVSAQARIREEEDWNRTLKEENHALTGTGGGRLILTFDDGPSEITGDILDILADKDVKALFFINGANVTRSREKLLLRAVEEGHLIGNHTYSHDYSQIYRSREGFMKDFLKNEKLILKTTDTRSMLVRFPGGSRNSLCTEEEGRALMEDLASELDRLGYVYMDWNVTDNGTDPQAFLSSLERQIFWRSSATILCHDRGDRALLLETLPRLIDDVREEGYTFVLPDRTGGVVRF
ncbi:MAG: polysaccharide deacetylase [Spirochaetales bacterium]|nr:polysaccharide deacetylase [Spirochaetales bacterium]